MHTKSESDLTSSAPSSPSRAVYFVQSPSRDSHDGDKSTTGASPMESPSHPSFFGGGRHSRNSSGSRFSGIFRSSSGRKIGRKRNEKGWPECDVVVEEGDYNEFDKGLTRRNQALLALCSFFILFMISCFIIWGASQPFKTVIAVKSFTPHNLYIGEGLDYSGVPTNLFTINASLKLNVYNPATFFGIHVSSSFITLSYSEIKVATGHVKKYYQPRKSHRTVWVNLSGEKVPLYGAGTGFNGQRGGSVPLTLRFEVLSKGDVVGKLVRTRRRWLVLCNVLIRGTSAKPITFNKDSCIHHS